MSTGKKLFEKKGHEGRTYGLSFSPDGHTFASGGGDGAVCLWDVASGQELLAYQTGQRRLSADTHSVAFSPDGKVLASGFGDTIRLWDLLTGKPVVIAKAHDRAVISLIFTPDGKSLVSGGLPLYGH